MQIEIKDSAVKRIRGDQDDVFSKGFICAKGSTSSSCTKIRIGSVSRTPAWLRRQRCADLRRGRVGRGLRRSRREVRRRESRAWEAIGVYLNGECTISPGIRAGVPPGDWLVPMFSASTVDQACLRGIRLYGNGMRMPVPDLDRTDLLVRSARTRSCRTAVSAPRPTSRAASEPFVTVAARSSSSIRAAPAPPRRGDLASSRHRPFSSPRSSIAGRHRSVARWASRSVGRRDERTPWRRQPFSPEYAELAGIDAETIERLADDIARAPTAAVHGRIGRPRSSSARSPPVIDITRSSPATSTNPAARCSPDRRSNPSALGAEAALPDGPLAEPSQRQSRDPGRTPRRRRPVEILEPGEGRWMMLPSPIGAVVPGFRTDERGLCVARCDGEHRHLPQ